MAAWLTYPSGQNPPGGFWKDDEDGHVAGTPVLRDKFPASYGSFQLLNAMAFWTSLLLMVLVSSERFYRTRARMTALVLVAVLHLASFVCAFVVGSYPSDPGSGFLLLGALIAIVFLYCVGYIGEKIWKLWWYPDEATKQAAPV